MSRPVSGPLLYRFVVVADTHVNEAEDRASAFFPMNRLANARARQAFKAAAAYQPNFVIHLGDIVHPIPSSPNFARAVAHYRELERTFDCAVHLTPGNHDIGDKRWALAPVAGIEPAFIEAYEQAFGPQWSQWTQGPCTYFVLNASLMNAGLPDEARQRDWFIDELRKLPPQQRKFLSLHYPPYLRDEHEAGHYDNIDEPARTWLLDLLRQHDFEAVFCGHVHNFWYDRVGGAEMYLLPSTAFVRQDYSELQRVTPPGEEGGRQDIEKLGFMLVDVHERGHVARFMRCGQPGHGDGVAVLHGRSPHPKCPVLPSLGADMDYPWAEDVVLPPNPALDEFRRKKVRNDYPLLALFELGLSLLRVPIEDLDDPALFGRLQTLVRGGMRAQVVVSSHTVTSVQAHRLGALGAGLDSVEWVLHDDAIQAAAAHIRATLEPLSGVPVLLSKLRRPSDAKVDGLKYGHLVFHGWIPAEAERIGALLSGAFHGVAAGGVLRVRCSESVLALAHQASELSAAYRAPFALMVRMATDNPATQQDSGDALVERVVEAAIAAWRYPELRIVIDGLVDRDRGFFRRLGLIGRDFNPSEAAKVLRHLQPLLASLEAHPVQIRRHRSSGDNRFDLRSPSAVLSIHLETRTASLHALQGDQTRHYNLLDGRSAGPAAAADTFNP